MRGRANPASPSAGFGFAGMLAREGRWGPVSAGYAPMKASEKMPFELTPIFYKLQRYEAAWPPAGDALAAASAPPK